MREQTFMILTALAARPLHGYGIIGRVAQLSGGDLKLGAGTLYGALDRLLEVGWVRIDKEEIESGRLRRYYVLTEEGSGALEAEATRREALARAVRGWLKAGRVPRRNPSGAAS